jgi:hypothetical protein
LFPEGNIEDSLIYNYNRALLSWYVIDPLFYRSNALTPPNVDADMQSDHRMREILESEVFPNRQLPPGTPPNIASLDLTYYPSERGQYNFDQPDGVPGYSAGLNEDGTLKEPDTRWGGIQRALTTTDFEMSNVQFIQFWLMDPFHEDSPNVNGGDLYFNLGNVSEDVLNVTGESEVFFLQEGKDQKYQIYFGNSSVGKALNDGAIINISYLVTSGVVSNKSTSFVVSSTIPGLSNYVVDMVMESSGGSDRESVESIKTNSVLSYSTQNRLVTVKDYESYLLKTYPVIDSISVWGGEDEIPPVYGKVFISMKPKTNYFLSSGEKQRIIDELIKPKSMISIQSEIRDPEFLFLKLQNKVRYDKRKTSFTEEQLKNSIKTGIFNYSDTFLDKFESTLVLSKLQDNIDAADVNSIIGSETILRLEKRFKPVLDSSRTYEVNFDAKLHRGTILNRLVSSEFTVNDNTGVTRDAIIEETPESFTGVSSISVSNPGYGYTTTPTVIISGDGFGAAAVARIVNGKVQSIEVTNRGINYTKAVISFSGGNGFGAEAIAVLDARFGTLRTVYFNNLAERQIIDSNVGTIDYETGLVTITNIRILSVTTDDGTLRLDVESEDGIISSKRNTIITIDKFDPSAITTDLTTA